MGQLLDAVKAIHDFIIDNNKSSSNNKHIYIYIHKDVRKPIIAAFTMLAADHLPCLQL